MCYNLLWVCLAFLLGFYSITMPRWSYIFVGAKETPLIVGWEKWGGFKNTGIINMIGSQTNL